MSKPVYYAIFLGVTAMLVTLISYVGYAITNPVIEQNTIDKINANIALLFNPEEGYTRNENQMDNSYNEDDGSYSEINSIYEVLDENGDLYALIYDMGVQGRNDVINALVAVDPYTDTIIGVTYYDHAETPNIGERYTRDEEREKLVGQSIDNVVVDQIAGATTTWGALDTMFTIVRDHYNKEVTIDG